MFLRLLVLSALGLLSSAHNRDWGDSLADYGVPGWKATCDPSVFLPSKEVPKTVHSLRPADIKVVMALGDSITAANGAGAEDPLAVVLQYRGLAYLAGGDKNLDTHVTIPNILKQFNPNIFGYSNGIGSPDVWDVAKLNVAYPGAHAHDLEKQARSLISKLQAHPDVVDMQNDWKLLNIFIGGNDACGSCKNPNYDPNVVGQYIQSAVQIIKDNIPRTIVSLTGMLHLELLRNVDTGLFFCDALHVEECGCEQNMNFTNDQLSKICEGMILSEHVVEDSGVFDDRDDFTFVIQPFMENVTEPPTFPNGTVDMTFFCPDCFHFSQYGHATTGVACWNNMIEPYGGKTFLHNITTVPDLKCPDPKCPFFRTKANSADCSKYWTDPADSPIQPRSPH